MQALWIPGGDWVTNLVNAGPPCLLVVGLVVVLQAARGKIQARQACIYSGIVAVFFGLWILTLPLLHVRRIVIVTDMPSQLFASYSLNPIQYSIDSAKDLNADLDNRDIDFPNGANTFTMQFKADRLIHSYEENLDTVARTALNNPECLKSHAIGHTWSQIAKIVKEKCNSALLFAPDRPAAILTTAVRDRPPVLFDSASGR